MKIDQALMDSVKMLYLKGMPLAEIARKKGYPTVKTIKTWADKYEWCDPVKAIQASKGGIVSIVNPYVLITQVDDYFATLYAPETREEKAEVTDDFGRKSIVVKILPLVDENDEPIMKQVASPTLAGLAIYLKMTQKTLKRYIAGDHDSKLPAGSITFSEVLAAALDRIEEYNNQLVYNNGTFKGAELMLNTHHDVIRKTKTETTVTASKKLEDYF